MNEASKTSRVRSEEFNRRYFSGRVIDIGCGRDPVVPHAVPFDVKQGDAQCVSDYFESESFDCVHSSHCLEHMRNVPVALGNWWALVKPGGYLVTVVPHEDLYEQGFWPSLFNSDHKATFRLGKKESWSPISYDLGETVAALRGAHILDAAIQDQGYDYTLLRGRIALKLFPFEMRRRLLFRKLISRGLPLWRADLMLSALMKKTVPVDQTLGKALAQIQVVAQKTSD